MSRWILFLIALALGIAGGLYYGWRVNPVEYVDTTPDTLRADYQTDFVLMVAETFQADGDLNQAAHSLAVLGDPTPADSAAKAVKYASNTNPPYSQSDLALMQALATALKNMSPAIGGSQP